MLGAKNQEKIALLPWPGTFAPLLGPPQILEVSGTALEPLTTRKPEGLALRLKGEPLDHLVPHRLVWRVDFESPHPLAPPEDTQSTFIVGEPVHFPDLLRNR